ncbi:MAG: N-acyl-D-aspartate/D-glutamate deacylase [Porticoccus sp.]|jgi:N-acyl-D-aspartate/D-glutamate deacylase
MKHLIIQNGKIVDGIGKSAFVGDIAIKDGKISAIGDIAAAATKTINAKGQLIAPGWVDVHSHMDGQTTWDPYAALLPTMVLLLLLWVIAVLALLLARLLPRPVIN